MAIGLLTLHVRIPGCTSLKEKRRRLKPLLVRLHREFNISVAEMEGLDSWQEAVIACTMVSNGHVFVEQSLQQVATWMEASWPDVDVVAEELQIM